MFKRKDNMRIRIALTILIFLGLGKTSALPVQINNLEPTHVAVSTSEQPAIAEIPQPITEQPKEAPQPVAVQSVPQPIIGCEQYRLLLSQYDWNVNVMQAIMKAESSCSTNAVGDNYPINGIHAVSCGLLQIRTLASRPSCDQLKDPATNIAWGYKIYTSQGYRAWSVCRSKVACY